VDKTSVHYVATVTVDEVALRATPVGQRSDDRFHNLVASLRNDVRLLVEGGTRAG
jgi:hypothetical protein